MQKSANELKAQLFDQATEAQIQSAIVPDLFTSDDAQILFLGTSSMKPVGYRGASAVYYFGRDGAVLMDSAEGSYGQLWD